MPVLRSASPRTAPLALLLGTLVTIFLFAPDRSLFLGKDHHNLQRALTYAETMTYAHLLDAVGLAPKHYFGSVRSYTVNAEGEAVPAQLYNRFPVGGRLILHLATLPFEDPWMKVHAARTLVIVLFLAAAALAYCALIRLQIDRWAAVAATLLAFGSSHLLTYHDMVATLGVMDLFGVMLVFHGMAVWAGASRARSTGAAGQLFAKTCAALLLGWHVYGLLLPFLALGVVFGLARSDQSGVFGHVALGLVALAVGTCLLAFNVIGEFLALGGKTPWTELPTVRSALSRTGLRPLDADALPPTAWWTWGWTLEALWMQCQRVGVASLPHFLSSLGSGFDGSVAPHLFGGVGVAVTLAAVGLAATAKATGGRVALLSIACAGWCWALPMRNQVHGAGSEYEALFFVGAPLVCYALALRRMGRARLATQGAPAVSTRRRWPAGPVAAAAASLCFLGSAWVMDRERRAVVDFAREAVLREDVKAIRALAREGAVLYAPRGDAPIHWKHRKPVLLAGRILDAEADQVVAFGLPGTRSRTPHNQHVFLYRRSDYEAALADSTTRYRTAMQRTRPLVSADCCDVYLLDDELLYHDRDCRFPRKRSLLPPTVKFFLHVTPKDPKELSAERRRHGFDNHNFRIYEVQHRDGLCFTARRLPPYEIAEIHTGQFQKIALPGQPTRYDVLWEGRFTSNTAPD